MPSSRFHGPSGELLLTAAADQLAGDIIQCPDGRAGQVIADCKSGKPMHVRTSGLAWVKKPTATTFAVGVAVFWDYETQTSQGTLATTNDFLVGIAVAAGTNGPLEVLVDLNVIPIDAAWK
jgi:predicted RecA/RadA family phage recombinase